MPAWLAHIFVLPGLALYPRYDALAGVPMLVLVLLMVMNEFALVTGLPAVAGWTWTRYGTYERIN